MTIRSTPRFYFVAGTLWPDQDAHEEWGAWSAGKRIGNDGTYTMVFLVPPTAPVGAAETDVAVTGIVNNIAYQNQTRTFWEIATSC